MEKQKKNFGVNRAALAFTAATALAGAEGCHVHTYSLADYPTSTYYVPPPAVVRPTIVSCRDAWGYVAPCPSSPGWYGGYGRGIPPMYGPRFPRYRPHHHHPRPRGWIYR